MLHFTRWFVKRWELGMNLCGWEMASWVEGYVDSVIDRGLVLECFLIEISSFEWHPFILMPWSPHQTKASGYYLQQFVEGCQGWTLTNCGLFQNLWIHEGRCINKASHVKCNYVTVSACLPFRPPIFWDRKAQNSEQQNNAIRYLHIGLSMMQSGMRR